MADQETNQKTADKEQAPSTGRLTSSIGMALPDGSMRVFLPKGSRLPCEESSMRLLARLKEYSKVKIQVFVGESNYVDENIFLGEVGLENIRLNKEGQALLDIVFSVDSDNLLHISIKDDPGKKASNATFRIPSETSIEPGIPGKKLARRNQKFPEKDVLLEKITKLEEKMQDMEKELGIKYSDDINKKKTKSKDVKTKDNED